MILRKVTRLTLEQRPYEAWNAFVDLVASESYDELNEVQRVAHLCFWYESEVQNGGHLQYFENRGVTLLNETLNALGILGGACQHEVLLAAGRVFTSKRRNRIETAAEYVTTALANEFGPYDSAFYQCKPGIEELLANYLEQNRSQFIEIADGT
jgi:hypothetical protein